jgi:parallel beta-helix repeat protein
MKGKTVRIELNLLAAGMFLAATSSTLATVRYVWQDSPSPTPPYANWANAAATIQDAADAAAAGDEIVVTNGVYATGGRAAGTNVLVNRVAVDKPLTLRSVNGPQFTVIQGYQVPGTTNGDGAIRCVYLTNGASLSGFTLTNGATGTVDDWSTYRESTGGGAWCESTNAVVSNCVLSGNSAYGNGGGAYGGTLNGCTLAGNSASLGGGVAGDYSLPCTLNNCVITGNSASYHGGGAYSGTLNNCTLTGNSAHGNGGGALGSMLNNCVAYFNTAAEGANYWGEDLYLSLSYCCTTPMPTNGIGNITNAPLFVDYAGGNLRLQTNSPCINAGLNAYAPGPTDLDGLPRIVSGTVDIGAYEFQEPGSAISYAWLQQYGRPTAGSADFNDPDHDGLNNWQEWRCGTCPTNALSALRLLAVSPAATNLSVTWQSVAGVSYFLERSTNLSATPCFTRVATNLPGQPGTTSYSDTTATNPGPYFYRVGVGN